MVERSLAASSARGYHWRNISEARSQAKGIERAVCIMKKGSMPIGWHLNAIAMPGLRWNPPFGYLIGHVYRTYNAYCTVRERLEAPLRTLREKRGGQGSWVFETNSPFKMAWSAFGVVPFSRHEICDWWRLFGIPVFC